MTKSNSQRQAEYRARHLKAEDSKAERLNTFIDLHAKRALERLSSCYGVTQRAMLERLLVQAEQAAIDQAGSLPNGASDYYDKRLKLKSFDVTQ